MCVLMIAWRMPGAPRWVVAANRDESRARPSHPPRLERCGARRALVPRDEVAGGTWLGVNDAGVAVALTNRADATFDPRRPSRGRLPEQVLGCATAAEARDVLAERVARESFNGFNLFCADDTEAWVARWNGTLDVAALQPGTHVLTNSHDLDVLEVPELSRLPWGHVDWPVVRAALQDLLGDHAPRDGEATPLCKHGDVYGTVSAALFHPLEHGGWRMSYADGNPCTTPFVTLHLDAPVP